MLRGEKEPADDCTRDSGTRSATDSQWSGGGGRNSSTLRTQSLKQELRLFREKLGRVGEGDKELTVDACDSFFDERGALVWHSAFGFRETSEEFEGECDKVFRFGISLEVSAGRAAGTGYDGALMGTLEGSTSMGNHCMDRISSNICRIRPRNK